MTFKRIESSNVRKGNRREVASYTSHLLHIGKKKKSVKIWNFVCKVNQVASSLLKGPRLRINGHVNKLVFDHFLMTLFFVILGICKRNQKKQKATFGSVARKLLTNFFSNCKNRERETTRHLHCLVKKAVNC